MISSNGTLSNSRSMHISVVPGYIHDSERAYGCTYPQTRLCGICDVVIARAPSFVVRRPSFVVIAASCSHTVAPAHRTVRRSFVLSFNRSFVRSFNRSFVRSCVRSFVRAFVRSFVRALDGWMDTVTSLVLSSYHTYGGCSWCGVVWAADARVRARTGRCAGLVGLVQYGSTGGPTRGPTRVLL